MNLPSNAPKMDAVVVMYDIPEKSKLRNPSDFMWRFAFKLNKSCWVVPLKSLPLLPLNAWRDKGADVEVVDFTEREVGTLVRLAKKKLGNAFAEMHAALAAAIERAKEKYEHVAAGDDIGLKRANDVGGRCIRRAKNFLASAQECAVAFGITAEMEEFCNGLRLAVQAREQVLFSMHDYKRTGKVPLFPEDAAKNPLLAKEA